MAFKEDFLNDARALLAGVDTSTLARNDLIIHAKLLEQIELFQGGSDAGSSVTSLNFDIGSLVRVAGQEVPWGGGKFRTFYADATFTVPDGVTSMRIWVAAGSGSGAGPENYNSTSLIDGTDGGSSAVTGTGIALAATGGGAGLADGSGGVGGVGSGGDENYTGGDGSDAALDGNCGAAGSGGGHATQWGNGGDAGASFAANGSRATSGGGGSVFDGGDASSYGAGAGASAFGPGESASVDSVNYSLAGTDCIGTTVHTGTATFPFDSIKKIHPYDGFWYAGGYGRLSTGSSVTSIGHGGAPSGGNADAANSAQEGGTVNTSGPQGASGAVAGGAGTSGKRGGSVGAKGAGGGGGGVVGSTYNGGTPIPGGGAGGGGFTRKVCVVTPGQVLTITVGRGGFPHYTSGGLGGDGFVLLEW